MVSYRSDQTHIDAAQELGGLIAKVFWHDHGFDVLELEEVTTIQERIAIIKERIARDFLAESLDRVA